MTTTKGLILTLDHNQRNLELLSQFLGKAGYKTLPVTNLETLDLVLGTYGTSDSAETIDLALVDISGFDQRIWQHCARLQANDIPLLIISPRQSVALQQESLAHGARGVVVKPLVVKDLLRLITALTGKGIAHNPDKGTE